MASLPSWFLAVQMWIVPHWFTFRFDANGRSHPVPCDSYGRPRRALSAAKEDQ